MINKIIDKKVNAYLKGKKKLAGSHYITFEVKKTFS